MTGPGQMDLERELAAARDRGGFLLTAEGYCVSEDCTVREVTVLLKEMGRGPAERTVVTQWACPVCGEPLKLHHVRTAAEENQNFEQQARMSVNTQRWERDHPGELAVPATVFLDDRLPA